MGWLPKLRKSDKLTFLDEIFFTIPHYEPFSLDIAIVTEYTFKFRPNHNPAISLQSLLDEDPTVRNFVDTANRKLENYKIIKRVDDKQFIKGENYLIALELGGYSAYLNFRKRELDFPSYQRKINFWLIFGAILGGLSPVITTFVSNKMYKPPPTQVNIPSQYVQHTVVTLDSLSLSKLEHSKSRDTISQAPQLK